MAAGDVARLVLQVDAQVELARRNISALAAAVAGDAAKMDASLKQVDNAHARLARSSGSARIAQMEFMHVITASSDALNAGIPASRVFAMEMGRLAQAAEFATQGTGAFAKFIQGPWGLALQVGVSLLTMLALRHGAAKDKAIDHRTAEETLTAALQGQKISTDDLLKAMEDLRAQEDKSLRTETQTIDTRYRLAQATMAAAVATREKLKADLEAERGALQSEKASPSLLTPGGIGAGLGRADISASTARINDLSRQIDKQTSLIASSTANMNDEIVKAAHLLSSSAGRIQADFERRQAALEIQYRGGNIDGKPVAGLLNAPGMTSDRRLALTAELARQEDVLREKREAATRAADAAAQAERNLTGTRQMGRQVTLAEAEAIVRGIGGRITSAQRSSATQAELYAKYRAGTGSLAAPPGHSFHESGQALDVAKGGGMTLGRLVEAFRSQGIQVREQLDEGSHFHIAFGKAGPSPEASARSAASAATAQRHDAESFAAAQAAADQRLAAAQEAAAKNAEDSVDMQIARIGMEQAGLDEATKRNAAEHHWTDAETRTVLELNRRWAAQRVSTAIAQARDQLQIGEAGLRNEMDLARAREQLATTTKERRDAAIALLDLAQQQERLELEALLASKEATDAQKKIAQARLDMLPQLRSLAVQSINRQNEGPGQRFLSDINSRDINSQLDEVKVRGLQGLEDELAGVISGTESVSSAFKHMAQSIIADLARIAIEKEIVMPLANMLFGGGGGGGGGDLLSAFGASTGNFGGGFAAGGDPPVGKWSLVGEKGPELIRPRAPMTVIPNHMMGRAAGGGAVNLAVHITTSDMLEAHVAQSSVRAVGNAAPAISAGAAQQVVRLLTRRGING